MKCPVCVEQGLRSTVHAPGYSVSTSMFFSPYWDEDGKYHLHDLNTNTSTFSCSQRHRWSVVSQPSCPSGDWKGTRETHVHPLAVT